MPKIARVDDTISHGGTITTGATKTFANSKAVARLGDHVNCNTHGDQTITSASTDVLAEAKGVARVGDKISCGAFIKTGSPNVSVDDGTQGMLGAVIIRPPPGQSQNYTGPWLVTDPTGMDISTVGTTSQGLQEALLATVAMGAPFRSFGQGALGNSTIGNSSTYPPVFFCSQPLFIPACFEQDFDFGNCNIVGTFGGSSPVLTINSCMMTRIKYNGQIIGSGSGPSILLQPKDIVPIDGSKAVITACNFEFGSLGSVGGGGLNSALMMFDCSFGSFISNYLRVHELECIGNFDFGMAIDKQGSLGGTTGVLNNILDIVNVHTFTKVGLLLGGYSQVGGRNWGANVRGNKINFGGLRGGGPNAVGINCFGNANVISGGEINGEEGGLDRGIIISPNDSGDGGNRNMIMGASIKDNTGTDYVNGGISNYAVINGAVR